MSRTTAFWTSAIVTIAVVLIVGAALLRPSLSRSATAQQQAAPMLVIDPGASQGTGPALQQVSDEHGDHEGHFDSDEEHDDHD